MVDVKNNRWVVSEDVFASRVMLPDLAKVFEPNGFFKWMLKKTGAESIVIEPGTVAYFVEEGEAVGHLPAGTHTMKSVLECLKVWKIKQATVILTRGEDQHFDIDLYDIPTREDLYVDAEIRLSIQIRDVALFLDNYMGVQSEISFENIRENLIPLITQSVQQAIRMQSVDDLKSGQMVETLSSTISEQLPVRMRRYGFNFIQIQALSVSSHGLDELNAKRNQIALTEQHVQDNLRRLKVNSDLRDQHLSGAIDKIETKEEYADFISRVDKHKLIREDDVEELVFEFDNRKTDRKTLRDHMIRLLDIKRDFELESLSSDFEYQTDITALNREIDLAAVSHTKDSAALVQMLELQKEKRAAQHEQQRADWELWRDKQDVQRDESWEQTLHDRQLKDVEADIAIAESERDSRVALIQDELQNKLENTKLVREQRRKEWELDVSDRESDSQLGRLSALNEINAKFHEDETRLKHEMEELKLDKSSQRRLDEIASLKGSTTEELVALADTENARLLVDLKTNEAATQNNQAASEQAAKAAEEKGAAVAQALKDAMQDVKEISITAITSNSNQTNNSNSPPPPPAPPAPPVTSEWFLRRGEETKGPWPHGDFVGFVKGGSVTVDCQVQKAGTGMWSRAGDCAELSFLFGGDSPPPPPPPPSAP